MESVREEEVSKNVKSLLSKFEASKLSGRAGSTDEDKKKKKKQLSPSGGCLSTKSERSIEFPWDLKGKQVKTPPLPSGGCLSAKSVQSIEIPLVFKDKPVKKNTSPSSGYLGAKSEQSIELPWAFKDKQVKKNTSPSSGYLGAKSEQSIELPWAFKDKQVNNEASPSSGYLGAKSEQSIELPWAFKDKQLMYAWIMFFRLIPHNPPVAAYALLRTDHRGNAFSFYKSREQPHVAKSVSSSETSDYSSEKTVGSGDSQDDLREKLVCDICREVPAVKVCLTCHASYCEVHVRQHYTVEALQRHKLRDLCDEAESQRCRHDEERLDFFCRTDQMPICSICAMQTHSGHDVVPQTSRRAGTKVSVDEKHFDPELPHTVVPPPGKIEFVSVKPTSVVLQWGYPQGTEGPISFRVKWTSITNVTDCLVKERKFEINNLKIGQKYIFHVATQDEDGNLSEWKTASVFTAVPSPRHLTKGHTEATAVSVKWTKGDNMEGIPHHFLLTIKSPGKESLGVYNEDCYKLFSDLEPHTKYDISVSTLLNNRLSEPVSVSLHTEPFLREMLSKIGLKEYYDNKLTLGSVLEIKENDISEKKPKSLQEAFLKRLKALNTDARSVKCLSRDVNEDGSDAINPLDLTTALFLCSDAILQQDIALKMSLCQFAIPLLLPNSETRETTMMLWSMREIVRTFSPSQQAFSRSSFEERLVLADIPLVSFVRIGKIPFSKSQLLNKLLSNTQHYHDTFFHYNMEGGDVHRRISKGLVEISWFLPCGNRSVDRFTEPLAVANLRGDVKAFDKQFSFLCQTSAVVYIFSDEPDADFFKNLQGKDVRAKVFWVSSTQGKHFILKTMTMGPSIKATNVSQKKKTVEELIKVLHESIAKMLEICPNESSVKSLADRARSCGIHVDEDSHECQSARKNVNEITKSITDSSKFKEEQLPCQGQIWKALSWLETEHWRLRQAGNQNPEDYRKTLKMKETEVRKKLQRFEMTANMLSFLHGMVTSEAQRYYFLRWLEVELDDRSRHQLSALQDQYKDLSQKSPRDAEQKLEIYKQISACSLRVEHFFRECGQQFQRVNFLPEYSRQRKTIENIPALCAQMLLDGFPLELVDGDAANIPMVWITVVLTELHYIMHSKSNVKVITIVGEENSGKSTLLNTMFGVRFAVGKATRTRGAFMHFLSVDKDVREDLGCDCLIIVDTEGLKPHQTVQVDHSHERDKDVASLGTALSDVNIVCISEETEKEKEILEEVLRAFTRVKHVGRKPKCHFVHVGTSAAKRKQSKDMVEKLDELIQKDAKTKKARSQLSDIMEFDPDTCSWDIPPIWSWSPPMAPVSVDYSEAAQALKKQLMRDLKNCKRSTEDLTHFIRTVESSWMAL